MNASSPESVIERPWVTYAKAALFLIPPLMAWVFACLFLVPKVKEISQMAGLSSSQLGWMRPAAYFLVAWGRAILVAGVLALVLLEFVAPRWWRRQLIVGIGIWLANAAVLCMLSLLLVIICMAAPGLAQPR